VPNSRLMRMWGVLPMVCSTLSKLMGPPWNGEKYPHCGPVFQPIPLYAYATLALA
jgi:hypothetical protein